MTNKQALIAVLQVSVDDAVLNKALLDAGFSTSDDEDYDADFDLYDNSKARSIDLCAIEVLQGLLSTPNITEGGYSITFDRQSVQARLQYLSYKNGVSNPIGPKVRRSSPW